MDDSPQPDPSLPSFSDDVWRRKVAARDAEAWKALHGFLYRWIYTYLSKRLYWLPDESRQETARECAQDAGEHIFARIDQYMGRGPFLGWCRVIARNATSDHLRREQRRQKMLVADGGEDIPAPDETGDDVERRLLLEEIIRHIDAFVGEELSERERMIWGADGEPVETLSASLQITSNHLYQIRFQARRKIRRHLEQQGFTREKLRQWRIL